MTSKGAPRTCVVSREEHPQQELVRVVLAPDGSAMIDYRGKLPGRGAWFLRTAENVAALEKKPGLLSRSLKAPVRPFPVREQLLAAVNRSVADGLSLAAASGALVGGHDVLTESLKTGRVKMVAVASDASERTVGSIREAAGDVLLVSVPFSRDDLGARTGRGSRAAVGVLGGRATRHLRRQLRRLYALG